MGNKLALEVRQKQRTKPTAIYFNNTKICVIIPNLKGTDNAPPVAHINAFCQVNGIILMKQIFDTIDIVKSILKQYSIDFPEYDIDIDSFILDLKKTKNALMKFLTRFMIY